MSGPTVKAHLAAGGREGSAPRMALPGRVLRAWCLRAGPVVASWLPFLEGPLLGAPPHVRLCSKPLFTFGANRSDFRGGGPSPWGRHRPRPSAPSPRAPHQPERHRELQAPDVSPRRPPHETCVHKVEENETRPLITVSVSLSRATGCGQWPPLGGRTCFRV